MAAPDPSEREHPASSACGVRVHQPDESAANSLLQEEHPRDLRLIDNDLVPHGVHMPHAERFEPKEEDWLLRGSSLANEVADGNKCYYCIASDIHAPHLHNAQLCTCAFRSANGISFGSTESATVLNATGSGPRFDPSQLLTWSAIRSDHFVPVNGPGSLVANGGESRARRNGMDLPPSSRSSMADVDAAIHPRPSASSPHVSGFSQGAVSSFRRMSRYDDPKGKRPVADLIVDDEPLMTTQGLSPITSRAREIPSAAPSPSDLSSADESDSSTESDNDADDQDDGTVAGDADDDHSSHMTGPFASLGTLDNRRKRRRRDSTDDDPRPRFAATNRIYQHRRLERTLQRAGTAALALSRRASCSCILTINIPSETTANANTFRAVAEPPASPHGSAMETLEQSHQRVGAYLSSCFASNQRLRAELAEAREDIAALEERLAEAEKAAFEYWERWVEA